jgi:8-oxo-dGTP diphosphatase
MFALMQITDHRNSILSRVVHVAVGVIIGNDGAILIAKRPDKTHQGGLWEFPGGKVEHGETLFTALQRELREELAIDIIATEPLIKIRHDYGDKIVLLDVHKVTHFSGEAKGNEGQPIVWVAPKGLHHYQFPAANRPIIAAIHLSSRLLITGAFAGLTEFSTRLTAALNRGIKLVQLRVKESDLTSVLVEAACKLCDEYGAALLINTDPEKFANIEAQKNKPGLHLNSKHLLSCDIRPVGTDILLSASCHNEKEIEHAQKIGVDFICVSPVSATQSHPEQQAMGWDAFERLVEKATIPVFALGGMKETDLLVATERGAQGIAAISEWW